MLDTTDLISAAQDVAARYIPKSSRIAVQLGLLPISAPEAWRLNATGQGLRLEVGQLNPNELRAALDLLASLCGYQSAPQLGPLTPPSPAPSGLRERALELLRDQWAWYLPAGACDLVRCSPHPAPDGQP